LNPNSEDVACLAEVSHGRQDGVPPFNLSRLLAMGLVATKERNQFLVTEKGQQLLASRAR